MALVFKQINRLSAVLILPYILWMCYALSLNIAIAVLNPVVVSSSKISALVAGFYGLPYGDSLR